MVDWSGGQSTPAGKQQLKIPQEAVFASEEAEALPAESDCPQRKATCSYVAVYRFCVKNNLPAERVIAVLNFGKTV